MNAWMLSALEYYRIRDDIASYCMSEEGKDALKKREPFTDSEIITHLKALSRDWQRVLPLPHPPVLAAWPPVASLFSVLGVEGAALTQEQLYAIGLFCTAAETVKKTTAHTARREAISSLAACAQTIPPLETARAAVFQVLTADGALKDTPELCSIRDSIARLNKKIDPELASFTKDPRYAAVLESTVPAYRAGHQVLAVHAGHHHAIRGIIHDVSQSGQTVYITPDAVVRTENELVQEEARLQRTVKDIFRKLTAALAAQSDAFERGLSVMLTLDGARAAACWGSAQDGTYAEHSGASTSLALKQARHPLLGKTAVPIDIACPPEKRILIITGPNTGGKTVALKTIALCVLLNQSGFPIPAESGSVLPLFTDMFIDIGDGQSIDDALSTFSAHMKRCAKAIAAAQEQSLVMLDELGSGTDPQEGAAIALAVLDELRKTKAFVFVTTHHGAIKNYGWTHNECVNASVEFDAVSLLPTYRIAMGFPGESHAFDIALQSGIPPEVIAHARAYSSGQHADVSALITSLTAMKDELAASLEQAKAHEAALREREQRLSEKELSLRERAYELDTAAQADAQQFLSDSKKQLEQVMRTIREGALTFEKTLAVKQYIADVTQTVTAKENALADERQQLKAARKKLAAAQAHGSGKSCASSPETNGAASSALWGQHPTTPADSDADAAPVFTPGMSVTENRTRQRGTLVSKEKSGWLVQFGSIRMTVSEHDLSPCAPPARSVSVTVDLASHEGSERRPAFELRLLGMRQNEALRALEQQIDCAVVHDFKTFSIIHGKGDGVLQQAVHDYLSRSPVVQEFHFAPPEDGGTGKTAVTLF